MRTYRTAIRNVGWQISDAPPAPAHHADVWLLLASICAGVVTGGYFFW